LSPAVRSVCGLGIHESLALWHGLTPAFLISLLAVFSAVGVYLGHRFLVRQRAALIRIARRFGPEHCFAKVVKGIDTLARFQTRLLQSGYLRRYLLTIITTTAALVAVTLLAKGGLEIPVRLSPVRPHEFVLILLILAAVVAAAWFRSRLAVIASLSVVGYGVAVIFAMFAAPDLAMTQFLVETLMLVLLIVAFYRLPAFKMYSRRATRARDLACALMVGVVTSGLILIASGMRSGREVTEYYLQHSVSEARSHNVVNAILINFRALDTLGEITVLATAALGVLALLAHRVRKKDSP
jgi:multicomponent Na+:H+ antiporter subunit A